MDQLVASLRALTISRGSAPTLDDIIGDYEEFEGCPIEVEKYGFGSIQELLVRSGEFSLSFKHGQTFVTARPHKDTEHIANMVRKQKKPSKKKRNSCKIYAHNFHIHADSLASRKKKRQAEREESESPKRRRSSSPDVTFVSSSTMICPPPPDIVPRRNNPKPANFDDSMSDSLPDTTFSSFHQSFPEVINNYNDMEVAVALEVFCSFEWIDPPFYHVYMHPHYRGFLCEVLVGTDYFNTEPLSFRTHLEAKLQCAFIALRSLHSRAAAQRRSAYGKNPRVLARKIYRELDRYPDGVSTKMIPKMFETAYGECLPPNWMNVIKRSSLFNLRVSRSGNVYVSANWCRK